MAEIFRNHADQAHVEAHEHHVAGIGLGSHVKRADDGTWQPCEEHEAHGQIVSEIAVEAAQPAKPAGRHPVSGDITPAQPAKPRTRQKVHIAIHPQHVEAFAAKFEAKE